MDTLGSCVSKQTTLFCNALCVVKWDVLAKHFAGMIAAKTLAVLVSSTHHALPPLQKAQEKRVPPKQNDD